MSITSSRRPASMDCVVIEMYTASSWPPTRGNARFCRIGWRLSVSWLDTVRIVSHGRSRGGAAVSPTRDASSWWRAAIRPVPARNADAWRPEKGARDAKPVERIGQRVLEQPELHDDRLDVPSRCPRRASSRGRSFIATGRCLQADERPYDGALADLVAAGSSPPTASADCEPSCALWRNPLHFYAARTTSPDAGRFRRRHLPRKHRLRAPV